MIQQAKKNSYNTISRGTRIRGKWHQNEYIVKKRLGMGAIGAVYLCVNNGRYVALKVSEQNTSITIEVNVLRALQKVQGNHLGPSLYDVDDWVNPHGKTYSFYVMEYIRGMRMDRFIHTHGSIWIGPFLLQLLHDLEGLHRAGWVFGDLKLDNLLIETHPPRIRLIDVGGTTQKGRAIKEYTEFYDRGYWGLGSRKAEPSYDLFALVMVCLHVFYPKRFDHRGDSLPFLRKKITSIRALVPYQACFDKALQGTYKTSTQMREDIIYIVAHHHRKQNTSHGNLPIWKRSVPVEFLAVTAITFGAYGFAWLLS